MAMQPPKKAGRPRSFDRDRALDCAMHLFWAKGYDGASISDLTAAMGIQPPSLYATFGNKQALFELALARYLDGPVAWMHAALEERTAWAVADRILRQTAKFLSTARGRAGCLTIQGALVGSEESALVRRQLARRRAKEQKALCRRFERARSEGDLPQHADPAALADFITTVFQGMTIQALSGAGRRQLLRIADTALGAWPR